ncbi:hypothetical protein [Pseudocolwellia agarivorans]|jgi:hypothetical protein|uniref:hypothetical protein n=1 Tax=Pseudocolwellia agarivorans TaxID=1911682 RepID=UPI003F882783
MKTIMIFLSALITVFTSTAALAHTDHGLGEGMLHATFHIVFWFVVFAVIYKATMWYRSRNKK